MLIFLLLRRLSPRSRTIVGLVLVAAGLALVTISAAIAAGLLIHGLALFVIGGALYTSTLVSRRRAQPAPRPGTGARS
jgi:drug/metabolite transporter (DMT)-like permease